MLSTHTILFLDCHGDEDWDRYTATCIPEAMEKFERDHPGRQYIYVASGIGEAIFKRFARAYGRWLKFGEREYQGVCQEDGTEYIFTYTIWSDHESIIAGKEHNMAIETFEVAFKESQIIREELGGFALKPLGLYQTFPEYKLVKDYTNA